MGAIAELDVRPGQPDGLADPQPGMGQELEEEPPALGDRSEQQLQLFAGKRLRPLVLRLDSPPSGMRTPATGFERSSPSSTAVANIAESAARVFLICEVERRSFRIAPKRSRTSPGSTSASRQVCQRGQRVGLDRSPVLGPRRLREPPRGSPGVGLDPVGEELVEADPRSGAPLARLALTLRLAGLGIGAERLSVLFPSMPPDDDVAAAPFVDAGRPGPFKRGGHQRVAPCADAGRFTSAIGA